MKSRILLILVILSGVFYAWSLQGLIQAGKEVDELALGTMTHPDLTFAPSTNYLIDFVKQLTDVGRMVYSLQLESEDFIYPLSYALFFGLLFIYLARSIRAKRWVYLLSLIFVVGMLFDWTENKIMVWIIDAWPKEIYDYYSMYAIASGVKWTSLGLGMLSLGILFCVHLFRRIKLRQ